MTLLTLDGVACATPDGNRLFSDLSFSLGQEAIGLVGRNGSGKSTLLHAIAGDVPLAAGHIVTRGRMALMRQSADRADATVASALRVDAAIDRLDRIAQGKGNAADMTDADWSVPQRMADALADVGLASIDPHHRLADLSGGEQMRVALAALLIDAPDILLLDEPTNNLDADGRAAIAALVARWKGGIILASHDRTLLDAMDRIIELTPRSVHIVGGNGSLWHGLRMQERARAETALEKSEQAMKATRRDQQRENEKQDRRDSRGRKNAAQSSDPRILLSRRKEQAEQTAARHRRTGADLSNRAEAALARARAVVDIVTPVRIDIASSRLPVRHELVRASGIVCKRDGRHLFGPLDLEVMGAERIHLTGRNGSGKTSLIRLIMGLDVPAQGRIWADRARMALLDQHLTLLGEGGTVADVMARHHPTMDRHAVQRALAAYGFRNQWAGRALSGLSGGERVRLALACLFCGPVPPQMLVLDEPTNHLDMAAVALLEDALARFDGAILCVSHDPAFCAALGLERKVILA